MDHRIILLRSMNRILVEVLGSTEINIALARDLIGMASEDMTKSKVHETVEQLYALINFSVIWSVFDYRKLCRSGKRLLAIFW